MHRDGQNSAKYYASRWASIKIHIIFDKYLIRARMKSLGGQICFTIIPDSLIDSIVETINHIQCENTSQQFSEQIFFSVTLCVVYERPRSSGLIDQYLDLIMMCKSKLDFSCD